MFIHLKSRNFIIFLLLLTSCVRIIEDPAKKYNTEFLRNNSMKINRPKRKHLALAKQQGINYSDTGLDAVDSSYYKKANGTSLKKKYRNRDSIKNKEEKGEIKYLSDDLSLYYKQRNLKDNDDFIIMNEDRKQYMYYLAENYKDYSKEKIGFADIEPSEERLYGNVKIRKDKDYKSIDAQTMQENFDYIDIMDRVKKEVYLENKSKQVGREEKSSVKKSLNSIKDRFMSLFK